MTAFEQKEQRGDGVRKLPLDFFDILCNRFLPVLSLTYISSVFGVAVKLGHPVRYVFISPYGYDIALWVALWVSLPGLFWMVIRNSLRYASLADTWYKLIAAIMCVTLALSYLLLPELQLGPGIRMFFVATIPVFFIQYWFFVRGGLPTIAALPLNLAGIVFFIYGQMFI